MRIPDGPEAEVRAGRHVVRLTNLDKPFWPECAHTKRDLLQYYLDVADVLLPHLRDRPMVMKRYPDGWREEHFFMKRTPGHAPDWIETCAVEHGSGSVIDFPLVQDRASLLWMVNLGCIDLNPWYSRSDAVDRPDVLNFDLDPVPPARFQEVRETALRVRDVLERLDLPAYAKTSGSSGIHVHVPLVRGPLQKAVWRVAKRIALYLEERRPGLVTARYRIRDRPPGRVLVDYNQNAWGRTLAAVYSVRPRAHAPVSMPLTWEEVEEGVRPGDFRLDNAPSRIRERGDLWRPLVWPKRGRADLAHAREPLQALGVP